VADRLLVHCPGTIIDTDKPDHELSREERWALGRIPPRDALALNEQTYQLMVKEYETGRRGNGWRVHRRYDASQNETDGADG
jgi:hypothetical protein